MPSPRLEIPEIWIAGVRVQAISELQVLAAIRQLFEFSRREPASRLFGQSALQKIQLVTPNPEMVVAAQADPEFRRVLNTAAISTPDGSGLIWAAAFLAGEKSLARFISTFFQFVFRRTRLASPIREAVTGTDLLPPILRLAAELDLPIFLLGAAPGVAELAAEKFTRRIPNLKVAGTFAGSPDKFAEKEILQKIDSSGARLLFVAFGAPAQELWIARNLPKFASVQFAAGIGGAFDFHAGRVARAPAFFRRAGLEWLWRLLRQPRRIGRIFTAVVRFPLLVFRAGSGRLPPTKN